MKRLTEIIGLYKKNGTVTKKDGPATEKKIDFGLALPHGFCSKSIFFLIFDIYIRVERFGRVFKKFWKFNIAE